MGQRRSKQRAAVGCGRERLRRYGAVLYERPERTQTVRRVKELEKAANHNIGHKVYAPQGKPHFYEKVNPTAVFEGLYKGYQMTDINKKTSEYTTGAYLYIKMRRKE